MAGCSSFPGWLASSGPSVSKTSDASDNGGIRVVAVTGDVTRRAAVAARRNFFSESLTVSASHPYIVGPGDSLDITIWEVPPALLFSPLGSGAVRQGATYTTLPMQMVSENGSIDVPYVGNIKVTGKSPQEIGALIAKRLADKANQPQVLVTVGRNTSATVTVVGEVTNSVRMPLTASGEHLLDAIAAAGGSRQPVGKLTVQLTRGAEVHSLPLETVIRKPTENVVLRPGDVVTVLFQPLSFIVLGATGKNEEVNFEAQGISLAQALARAGGLQDTRADARGVFVFRFEDERMVETGTGAEDIDQAVQARKVPVIYRLDLTDPAAFLLAQDFPIRDKDVMYVANAPTAELQKFLNILTSSIYSTSAISHALRQ